MNPRLVKASPSGSDDAEREFDLLYYASLDTASRFRLTVERSILLLQLANRDAASTGSPALTKRR